MEYLIDPAFSLTGDNNISPFFGCPGDGCGSAFCPQRCPENAIDCHYPTVAGHVETRLFDGE